MVLSLPPIQPPATLHSPIQPTTQISSPFPIAISSPASASAPAKLAASIPVPVSLSKNQLATAMITKTKNTAPSSPMPTSTHPPQIAAHPPSRFDSSHSGLSSAAMAEVKAASPVIASNRPSENGHHLHLPTADIPSPAAQKLDTATTVPTSPCVLSPLLPRPSN